MRGYRCPGQSERNLKAKLYRCSGCGYQVEIFSDELKARCPRCGKQVYSRRNPSCVDWCRAAEQCLGSEGWSKLKGKRG
ncbi:MAG: phosphohydrolase [bacterium]